MLSKEQRMQMRKAVENLILTECQSLHYYALQIGITPHSLKGFLVGDRTTHLHNMGKIRNYLRYRNLLHEPEREEI